MNTKEELIKKYIENSNETERLKKERISILRELEMFSGHKVGEIVRWTEKNRRKRVGGTMWHPTYIDMPDKVHEAVVTNITTSVDVRFVKEPTVRFRFEFKPIKNDGGISQNCAYPRSEELEWTGEIHKDYIEGNKTP